VAGQIVGSRSYVAESGGENRYLSGQPATFNRRGSQPQISGANEPTVGLHEPIDSEPEANNRVYSQSVCCNEQREGSSLELPFTRGNNRTVGTQLLITGSIHREVPRGAPY
jgi:hypothetical protein